MDKYLKTAILCLLISFRLSAQQDSSMTHPIMADHIMADRPAQSGTAYLVPAHHFQMEHGFSIEDTDPGFIYSYPSSLWKYGVNENFEVRLSTHYITIQHAPDPDVNGFLPLALGFKSKLTDQHGVLPKMAFIGMLTFPGIVSADFETTYFAPSLHLALTNRVSDMFYVNYNVGANWDGEGGEPLFTFSLAPQLSLTERLSIFGEIYGDTPQREADDPILRVDAGVSYLAGNDLLLDVSLGQGITDSAPERFVSVGLSYRFKL